MSTVEWRGEVKKKILFGVVLGALGLAAAAYAAENKFHQAKADTYDPAKTFLVGAAWDQGIGCPTNAKVATYPSTTATGTYTDPACLTGDSKDKKNEGLVLAKTGPTSNNAESFVTLKELKGVTPTELGYDLRKPGTDVNDPRGSHCGAGSPMFQLEMQNGDVYYVGCNSPAPTTDTAGNGWQRLRWGGSSPLQGYLNGVTLQTITGTIKNAYIVFQEGQDTGPDSSGLAVLDNIDVNGTLIGQGAGN
jgi:hypothetical protein